MFLFLKSWSKVLVLGYSSFLHGEVWVIEMVESSVLFWIFVCLFFICFNDSQFLGLVDFHERNWSCFLLSSSYFPLDFRPFGSSSSQSRFWLAPKFLSRIWLEFFCLLGCSNDGKHLLRDWSFFWTCNSERSFPPNFGSDVFEVCSFHIFQL